MQKKCFIHNSTGGKETITHIHNYIMALKYKPCPDMIWGDIKTPGLSSTAYIQSSSSGGFQTHNLLSTCTTESEAQALTIAPTRPDNY